MHEYQSYRKPRAEIPPNELPLTLEEAVSLLELAMLSPQALTEPQRSAMEKLGAFCRQSLRNSPACDE